MSHVEVLVIHGWVPIVMVGLVEAGSPQGLDIPLVCPQPLESESFGPFKK